MVEPAHRVEGPPVRSRIRVRDHAEAAVGFQDHGGAAARLSGSGRPERRKDLLARDALRLHRALEQSAAVHEECRLILDHRRKLRRTHRQPGGGVLQKDQEREREDALDQRDRLSEQHGRERRAERHRDHQIERVQLGQRALARDAQGEHQRSVGERADQQDAAEPGPGIEQHERLLRVGTPLRRTGCRTVRPPPALATLSSMDRSDEAVMIDDLLERLERAEDGSPELDAALVREISLDADRQSLPYTRSVDAALTLIPDDLEFGLTQRGRPLVGVVCRAEGLVRAHSPSARETPCACNLPRRAKHPDVTVRLTMRRSAACPSGCRGCSASRWNRETG